MPCYDHRNEPSYVREETRKESQAYIDKLTRLLCEANKLLDCDTHCNSITRSPELEAWWQEHQRVDKIRAKKKTKR